MRSLQSRSGLDAATLLVWGATLALGVGVWQASGTPIAGALVVASVPIAAAAPAGAFYATCASIPVIFHPVIIGSLEIGLLELGVLSTVAGTMLRAIYELTAGGGWVRPRWTLDGKVWIFPVLLVVIGTISLVTMPFDTHRSEALRTWRWVVVEPILFFALARRAISRHGSAALSLAIAVPAGVVASFAVWQLVESSSSFSVDQVHRSTGPYFHPNNLALYLERALFLVLIPGLLLANRWRWSLLVLSALLTFGLAATFSRGALLGLAIGGAVALLAHPVRYGWRILGAGMGTALIAFAVGASQRFTGAGSSGFIATREYLWSDSLAMIRDFPVTGIGLDQFLWLHQRRYIDPWIWSERYTSHPHNLLLDSWLSLGMAGVAFLFLVIAVGAWIVWTLRRGMRSASPWQVGALACLGAGLGHSLVDNGYFLSDLAALTWLSIALVVTCQETADVNVGASNNG